MQDHINIVSYKEKKSEILYGVKVAVLYLKHMKVGVSPYIIITRNPQTSKKKILERMPFMYVGLPVSLWKR